MSIRKRTWTTDRGVEKEAWVVDYIDQLGKRRLKTFATKKEADAWAVAARHEVSQGIHTPASTSITVGPIFGSTIAKPKDLNSERSSNVGSISIFTLPRILAGRNYPRSPHRGSTHSMRSSVARAGRCLCGARC